MNQHRVNPPKNPATGDDKPTKTTMKSNHDTVIQPRNDMLKDAKTPKGCISIQRPKQQTEGKTACLGQTISLRAHQQPGGKPAARGHNSSPGAHQQPEGTTAARGCTSIPNRVKQPYGDWSWNQKYPKIRKTVIGSKSKNRKIRRPHSCGFAQITCTRTSQIVHWEWNRQVQYSAPFEWDGRYPYPKTSYF